MERICSDMGKPFGDILLHAEAQAACGDANKKEESREPNRKPNRRGMADERLQGTNEEKSPEL